MLNISVELNEFINTLYGKTPTMNKTWQELYDEAFKTITKDVFRFQVAAARASVPCDQTQMMTFLVYEERLHINNAKFITAPTPEQAMKMLQLSAQIRTKVQAEYNTRLAEKQAKRQGTGS